MKNIFFAVVIACAVVIGSCTYDNLDAPVVTPVEFCDTIPASYELNIKTIIETNCAYGYCHNGFAPGDYTTYEGMLANLDEGKIEDRVIFQKDDPNIGMPPIYATGPQDLTTEELDIFRCWLEAGYPEN